MAYVRPAILTVGDVVSEAYMTQLRDNWTAYETHAHTASNDGAQLTTFDIFGTGADGDVTITGGTTTLNSGKNYDNLTIEASGVLDTAGFIVRVKGTLTMSSGAIIHNDGTNGVGRATPGIGGPKGDYPAGGRIGTVGWLGQIGFASGGQPGFDATNEDETETESDGGGGGHYTGGGTGAIGEGPAHGGAGGGGGGASGDGNTSSGGSGGGGGGPVDVRVAEITGTGTIRSRGGTGAGGTSTVGAAAGGGGGGGGGWLRIISLIAIPGTITRTVTGGGGGGGVNGGTSGASGAAGRVENIELTI